jgi:hypothetical protein
MEEAYVKSFSGIICTRWSNQGRVAINFTLSIEGLAIKTLLTEIDTYPIGLPHFWQLNGLDSLMQATSLSLYDYK